MLCGIPPFYNENLERMYELIKFADLRFPKKIKVTSEAQDLINRLLDRNPNTRLGTKTGIKEIEQHAFFADKINFGLVLNRKVFILFI